MRGFRRRAKNGPPSIPGERVLAAARSADDVWLVGTREALHALGPEQERWSWEQVQGADWNPDENALRVVTDQPRTYVVDDAARLLQLIRERVTASIVMQRFVPVEVDARGKPMSKTGVTVFARRSPGGREITWSVDFRGLDPEDPQAREFARAALADVQSELV